MSAGCQFQGEVIEKWVPCVDGTWSDRTSMEVPVGWNIRDLEKGRATRWKEPGFQSPDQRHHQMFETEINSYCVKFWIIFNGRQGYLDEQKVVRSSSLLFLPEKGVEGSGNRMWWVLTVPLSF